jgi:hypothetical protein
MQPAQRLQYLGTVHLILFTYRWSSKCYVAMVFETRQLQEMTPLRSSTTMAEAEASYRTALRELY